jgi:hypothetical protein
MKIGLRDGSYSTPKALFDSQVDLSSERELGYGWSFSMSFLREA